MKSIVGVFAARADAETAIARLSTLGVAPEHINLLAPGAMGDPADAIPRTDTESPGMGAAVGGAVGAAVGASTGVMVATLVVPGVGPLVAVGMAAAALLGGIFGGAAVGSKLEGRLEGIPTDELHVYEDALRKGRSVVLASVADDLAERASEAMTKSGAESLDAAREAWWLGLRDAEAAEYRVPSGDWHTDESDYRRGFEAALELRAQGKTFEQVAPALRTSHGAQVDRPAFRRGFERGQVYLGHRRAPAVVAN